ncbi:MULTISPECIES: hemerythrin domain-containing protein [Streptomyces]|uniref:Hemerythrin domain-containing protein n=1 Tax=Streptomyces eurythermus TaxID=42237 RepID=A0ABW6Z338_9ACTN|nr:MULTISPECIES: hemerythrin domain-containing protein [Streptomyces]QIS69647.1 hemerythrin domain-containing protein [Streptomyces sp. DSM 40868]
MDGLLWGGAGVNALPRHLRGFAQTHLALRRDSRRLVAAAPLLTSAGLPRAAEWWRQLRAIVDWHHRTEDEILWPGLIRHMPEIAAGSHRMVQGHVALDDSMFRVTKALEGGRAELIGGPVDTFDTVLRQHLHEEEELTFPAFARVPADVFAALERRVLAAAPFRVKRVLPPWLLDGLPQPDGLMPGPVRLVGRTQLEGAYRRSLAGILEPR